MTESLHLAFAGSALGAKYALVVLGFVVIYRATRVINFAQGAFVVMGAYLAYNAAHGWGIPFYLAIVVAMVMGAAIGVLTDMLILRHMVGQPVFAIILVTFGLLIVLQEVPTAIWGGTPLVLGDPWQGNSHVIAGVVIETGDLAALVLAGVVLAGFFALFRFSPVGVAMRAAASDPEAALAQGISVRRMSALSWGIAGAVGALAGVITASGPSAGLAPDIGFLALIAFPAMIVGGLDSAGGAVAGGFLVGITQALTQGWQNGVLRWMPAFPAFLGDGFGDVMPFVVMVLILLLRPYGLFGTKGVRRI